MTNCWAVISNNTYIITGIVIGERTIIGVGVVVPKRIGLSEIVTGITARIMKNYVEHKDFFVS